MNHAIHSGRTWVRLWLGLATLSCSFVATPVNAEVPVITNPADLHFLNVNEAFNPAGNGGMGSWAAKAPMPTARAGMAICRANDGTGVKIYAIGGREANPPDCSSLQTVEAYDPNPATDKWIPGLAMPTAVRWRAAAGTLDNIIYLVGGEARDNEMCGPVVGTVEAYDPVMNQWIANPAPMPTARTQVSLAVDAVSHMIYAIGGSTGSQGFPPFVALDTVEVYDPVTDTWTPKHPMTTRRALPSVGAVNGKIYAVGGQDANRVAINTVEEFDPAANDGFGEWTEHQTESSNMPLPRLNPGAAVLDDKIYVVGGEDHSGRSLSSVEVYDPVTDSWTTTIAAPMPSVRRLLGAAVVNNVLYAVGGESPTARVGQQVFFQITATNNPISYDALPAPPPGLTVNHTLGIISGVPTAHNDTGFPVTLTATNASHETGTKDVSFFIAAAAPSPLPSIIGSTCATARAGQPFTFQVLTENASPAAQLTASGLPYEEGVGPQLSIDPSTGLISGTVTDTGSLQSFGVGLTLTDTLTDGTTTTAHSFLQLTFISDPNFPILTSPSTATLVPNQPFTYTITADAPATFSVDVPALPLGLQFDEQTATISGIYTPDNGASHASEIQSAPDTTKIRPPLIANGQPAANNSTVANNSNGTDTGIGTGTGPLNFFEPIAVSRKTHATAGKFDINLPLTGNPGIECRSGGTDNHYQVVFIFPTKVTLSGASVMPGAGGSARLAGPPITSPDGTQITVNLTHVSNVQTITITLSDVNDGTNTYAAVAVPMGVLIGDTTADGLVDRSDVALTKSESGQAITTSNFREDVTANGSISHSDVSLVRSELGTSLPP